MNTRGQGLISMLVVLAILGIATKMMVSLMVQLTRQEAGIQRTGNWTAVQQNVGSNLRNLAGCSATVKQVKTASTPQSVGIMHSGNLPLLVNGQNLGYQLQNTSISMVYVGTASIPGYGGCTTPNVNKGKNNMIFGCGNTVTGNNNVVVGVNNTVSSNNNTIYANSQTVTTNNTVTGGGTGIQVYTQQAQITVSAMYPRIKQPFTQTYLVNLSLDQNLNITGCVQ